MINIILFTSLLYFIQLILPMSLARRAGEVPAEGARRAAHNLRESLPVFFAFALLSIYFEVQSNTLLALIWLVLRIVFVLIYASGFNTKPANEAGYVAQPLRSLVWFCSIICLIIMGINLI